VARGDGRPFGVGLACAGAPDRRVADVALPVPGGCRLPLPDLRELPLLAIWCASLQCYELPCLALARLSIDATVTVTGLMRLIATEAASPLA
jgi:hypothetical protein